MRARFRLLILSFLACTGCAQSHVVGDAPFFDRPVGDGGVRLDLAVRDAGTRVDADSHDLGVHFDGAPVDFGTDAPTGVDMPPAMDAGTPCDATAAGCGTIDAGPILSWEAFLPTASSLICDASLRCDGHTSLRYGMLFCQPRYIETIPLLPGGGDTRPVFDPAAGQACIDALATATSCVAFSTALTQCDPLFYPRSTAAPGEPCSVDVDCANGYCLLSTSPACEGGHCVAWADPGTPCARSRECAPGLGCNGGTCAPPGGAGMGCADDVACVEGLFCDMGACAPPHADAVGCGDDFGCVDALVCNGTCQVGLARDASCGGGIGFGFPICAVGTTCVIGHCRQRAPMGGTCHVNEDCPYDSGQCFHGTCVARPTIGDACTSTGPQCIFSACIAGVCSQLDVGQGPCNDGGGDRCLRGRYCDPGTHVCVAYAPEGGDCSTARCAAGLTCFPGLHTCGPCS